MDGTVMSHMLEIEQELRANFVERNEEIRGLMLAALSSQHVLFLGPPGTAKTQLVQLWSEALQARFFRRLLTKHTTPDEILGPVSVKGMVDNEVWRRVLTNKAADSEIVFLDEVFKCGSATLNALLSLMEERTLDNDGVLHKAPLISMVGASNEAPTDNDEGLGAFYDRFLLRYIVQYVSDWSLVREMIMLPKPKFTGLPLTSAELAQAQAEVLKVRITPMILEELEVLWGTLKEEGIVVSDRRLKQTITVMAAESWLEGFAEITPVSVRVAEHTMWVKPEDFILVKRIVLSSINPYAIKTAEIIEAANEAIVSLNLTSSEALNQVQAIQVSRQLAEMLAELKGFRSNDTSVLAGINLIERHRQTIARAMGLIP